MLSSLSPRTRQILRKTAIITGLVLLGIIIGEVLGIITPFLKVALPVISVAAEPVFVISGFEVTNSLLTTVIVDILLIALAIYATRKLSLIPSGFQNFVEWMIGGFHGLVQDIAGHYAARFFPVVMTIFLFIIVSNWLGLLPGAHSIGLIHHSHAADHSGYVARGIFLTGEPTVGDDAMELTPFLRPPSTDLNATLALALIAVFLTQWYGVQALGLSYFSKFINFNSALDFFVGILETISEFAKIISFAFRLFGNIFAGEVLLAVMAFLVAFLVPMPFYALEVFIGFIQAFVFMMLALVFFTLATISHHGGEHH